jgi:hypothetical protein
MFENLDQTKGQNLTGKNMPPKPTARVGVPVAPTAAKVEDMFAGVKDVSPAQKIPGTPSLPQILASAKKESSRGGLRIFFIIIIILVIIGLGIFVAGKFLGVDYLSLSSWQDKISGLLVKKQTGSTIIINNETPATPNTPEQPAAPTPVTPVEPAAPETPVVTPAPVASSTPIVASSSPTSTLDSDNDGLTDYQEINIYHTDPHNPDTDGDGYLDGAEVKAGYNPLGPGKLIQASSTVAMTVYKNTILGFQISVPSSWVLPSSNGSDPEFFSTVACSKEPNFFTCPSFRVASSGYGDGPDGDLKLSSYLNPVKLTSLIAGAVVIELKNGDMPTPGDDSTSWDQAYDVYFSAEQKMFVIYVPDRSLENNILPTFKLLK